jgi:protein-disulfide isomerase
MINAMVRSFAFAAVVTLLACSPAPAQQAPDASGSEVVARVGERAVTLKEIDDRWRADEPDKFTEALQKLYDGRRKAIDSLVAEALFAEAAKAKGLSPAAYEEAEVSRRVKAVTDADVASFYKTNINEMQGRSLEDMAPLINRFLQEQSRAAARQAVIADLRKANPSIRVLLEAPRSTVPLGGTEPVKGEASAPVTIVEYSDFQCPYCLRVMPTLKRLKDAYGDRVRVIWKDFPLTQIHPQAFKAAEAAHCAGDEGKFWEYHDVLFANQAALQVDDLKGYASKIALDKARFSACLDTSKYAERVRDTIAEGNRLGVTSTPTVYINGRALSGAYPYEDFVSIIDEELDRAKR